MTERKGYDVFVYRENSEGNIGGAYGQVTVEGDRCEPVVFTARDGLTAAVGLRFNGKGPNMADVFVPEDGKKMVAVSRTTRVGFQDIRGGRIAVQVVPIRNF